MSQRTVLYVTDAPEIPRYRGRPDQRPARLAELFPALWWFCCFGVEDVLAVACPDEATEDPAAQRPCLGLRTTIAQALARCERRVLSSSALLAPELIDVRERFLDFLRGEPGRWLHLDLHEIDPLCRPDATGDEALAYHLALVDTSDRAEALAYAARHGLAISDGLIRGRSQVEHLMGYEEIGPEERTVSREYIPRYTPQASGEHAIGLLAATVEAFGRGEEAISARPLGREGLATPTAAAVSWERLHAEFAPDGQPRLLIFPALTDASWSELRRLLQRHAHELHAMTIRGDAVHSVTADTPLRTPDGSAPRLSLGYDGIGFTADALADDPFILRFDPVAIASQRRFTSLLSLMAHLARRLGVEVRCAHAREAAHPFLVCTAAGTMRALPRR